jgi:phosphopantetheinyl transferase (holo-ACP synthase)
MGRDDTENPLGGNGMPILGIGEVMISISHCRAYATATAIAVGN